MNKKKRPSLMELAQAAFDKAAANVLKQAKETGTPVIIWEDGEIKFLPSDKLELKPVHKNGRKTVELVQRETP